MSEKKHEDYCGYSQGACTCAVASPQATRLSDTSSLPLDYVQRYGIAKAAQPAAGTTPHDHTNLAEYLKCPDCMSGGTTPQAERQDESYWKSRAETAWEREDIHGGTAFALTAKLLKANTENAELSNRTRWIPVSERLPEVDGKYLVVRHGSLVRIGTFGYRAGHEGHGFDGTISYWMELPALPEGSIEND